MNAAETHETVHWASGMRYQRATQKLKGLAAAPSRLQDDRQVLLQLGLADELVQPAGAQPGLGTRVILAGGRVEDLLARH